ncbi:hypothetical protein C8J46_109127 [Sphingomonas sp. PP-F2F-A104-K0414]|uniref:hypothetical protein n=1 Tax=Sphingomonas sp. PP-F2F-A104-K0414 TaxID=2135661 RepID=UPI00104AEE78|nr:hypothetical protein [Sphingomonas sp. PP-F2F-A104-K0414]TCP96431.1 hypothetical protein C8J46_109127 [Sphingomonas sp. PP-F2F-A104-K0414]
MSKAIDEDGRRELPIYGVELRERKRGAEVAIVSIPRSGADAGLQTDVWSASFGNVEAARMIVQVMMSRPKRWGSWVRMARILGREFLTGVIEAEVIGASRLLAEDEAEQRADDDRHHDGGAKTVHLSLVLEGNPRIVAVREGRAFMVLTLETMVEARRVWDWVRWQANAFHEWFMLSQLSGATMLEVMILNSMRIDEAAVKDAGLAAEGPRPLRYWRPAGRGGSRK